MPIEAISGATSGESSTASSALGELDSDAFLQLLVAQLRHQNPMEPADGSEMLRQSAQFTQVETLGKLAETQQELLSYQQTVLGSGLVGKYVAFEGADGAQGAGVVEALRFTDGGPVLVIDGAEIPTDQAIEVRSAPPEDG